MTSNKSSSMSLDDLAFARGTYEGSKLYLTDGQLIAAALLKVADAIESASNNLARHMPDSPDDVNDDVASAIRELAIGVHEANDIAKKAKRDAT